ncbi:MAG: 4Fe-4S dicluster domain-containing protein [Planctomycetota bacterium]|nr:4Fe-4S dicluster domain-containing protein [Planctomycetota bacterium]
MEFISGVDVKRCMRCGKCSASCPAFQDMDLHPQKVVAMVADGEAENLANANALWRCMSCFLCVERCPRDVRPANVIEAVKLMRIRQKGANHMPQDGIPAMVDDELPQQAIVAAMRKYAK